MHDSGDRHAHLVNEFTVDEAHHVAQRENHLEVVQLKRHVRRQKVLVHHFIVELQQARRQSLVA